MKCSECRDRIFEQLDGSLAGKDLQDFLAHLDQCPDCREELEAARTLDIRLKQEVPALWQSIEPSPVFLNRLKNMEFEPEKPSFWSLFDPIVALFQDHRPAMAAGLTVLVAIVIAITVIPSVIDNQDSETDMVARAPESTLAAEESSTTPAPLGPAGPKGIHDQDSMEMMVTGGMQTPSPTATTEGNLKFSWEDETPPTPLPTTPPSPEVSPLPAYDDRGMDIESGSVSEYSSQTSGITATSTQPKTEKSDILQIVINDHSILDLLEDWSVYYADVVKAPEIVDYSCSGSTVGIADNNAEPFQPILYICVNPASQTVLHFMLVE